MKDLMMKKKMMSDPEKSAKMSALEDVKRMMSDSMLGKLKGQVSVMSDSPEGLKVGLDKAQEIIGAKVSSESGAEPHMNDEAQMAEIMGKDNRGLGEEDADESDMLSEEDIDQEIAELQDMKAKLRQKKPVNAYNHREPSSL